MDRMMCKLNFEVLKMRKKKNANCCKGFTLMEIIIVIAIIAILAVIAIPSITGYVEEAKEASDLQVASNMIKATQIAVSFNQANLPQDAIIEVLWATGHAQSSGHRDKFMVREVSNSGRTSAIRPAGYQAKIPTAVLQEIQTMIIETSGEDVVETHWGDWYAIMDIDKSKVASENNFAFHINTSTGELALAHSSVDGVENIWVDEIGVDITRH